jgi:hypothetical protein
LRRGASGNAGHSARLPTVLRASDAIAARAPAALDRGAPGGAHGHRGRAAASSALRARHRPANFAVRALAMLDDSVVRTLAAADPEHCPAALEGRREARALRVRPLARPSGRPRRWPDHADSAPRSAALSEVRSGGRRAAFSVARRAALSVARRAAFSVAPRAAPSAAHCVVRSAARRVALSAARCAARGAGHSCHVESAKNERL